MVGAHHESPRDAAANTSFHVRRAVSGNAESLAWVVARLTPLLLAQAEYRLGPVLRAHYEPADLVQDAWLVALPRLPDLVAREQRLTPVLLRFLSSTLVYRINNLARKHLKGEVHQRPAEQPAESAVLANLPADQTGAVTQAVRQEHRDLVVGLLQELEEKDREILILRGIEQLPNATVAVMLGLSPDATTMRYGRALKRLRAKVVASVFDELEGE
jgi:RNA polymerase sigma factor (sigma-70 family)